MEDLSRSRDDALWAAEVARLLDGAPALEPPARAAVLAVLSSFADDRGQSPEQRADVLALLGALRTAPL